MAKEEKKPKPSRFTMAPLYFAAGLAVGYIILTKMVPAMSGIVDDRGMQHQEPGAWQGVTLALSSWVRAHSSTTITALAVLGLGGFVVPLLIRPARFLVWLAALAVFLFDVALVGGSYGQMLTGLLREANKVNR